MHEHTITSARIQRRRLPTLRPAYLAPALPPAATLSRAELRRIVADMVG
jgi:hypothetical protein